MPRTDPTQPAARPAPSIRQAAIGDVPDIHYLLEIYASQGNLLPRTMSELYRHLRDFFVIEVNGKIAACGALEIFTEDLGEIRSLAVADEYKGRGFGRLLVQHLTLEAHRIGLRRLMALTYAPGFFHKLGFKTVGKDTLPEKVWGICVKCYNYNNCDETAVLLELH
ncbi:MAG: N-acetyltransferase [Gammaproteobacteria bacterium]|nr:MAG: N-acetyltransferase [Gammaproteobacteria bacterium]